ncbi:MAG: rfaE2 [Acidimicrobiales bacterium]|nr:rfaE2 [Acidimicrobiales bacterium]
MTAQGAIVVVGDALLDVDVVGTVSRICPDAPVPVVDEAGVDRRPGGAGLAAVLAARAGAPVTLVTALGDDEAGAAVASHLERAGIEVVDLGLDGATPEKIRVRAGDQSLLRVDRDSPTEVVGRNMASAIAAVDGAGAVLVADYGRGVAGATAVRAALAAAARPVVWDPHPRGTAPTPGTTVVTPNRNELARFTPDLPPQRSALADTVARAATLLRLWRVGAAAVTLGGDGAVLVRSGVPPLVTPALTSRGDTCGAGDCFAAATVVALSAGRVLSEAVEDATAAASAFVAAGAASSLTTWHPGDPLAAPIPTPRRSRPQVVATGGCFDLLHAGHVGLLAAAASLGDRLVVLLNSDRSVRRLKGAGRPLQAEGDRRSVLLALGCVDDVVIFDEPTPAAALERLRPDIFVKGGDYAGVDLPEAEVLQRWGGQVAIVPYLDGRSTTRLVQEARRGA